VMLGRLFRGCSLMVKPLPSKQVFGVRFSAAAPDRETGPWHQKKGLH
jgi:hypothetical protein